MHVELFQQNLVLVFFELSKVKERKEKRPSASCHAYGFDDV